MLATAERIIETWKTKPDYQPQIRYALQLPHGASPTIKYVDGMLDRVWDRIESNDMGKGTRPWEIMDLTSGLDPEQCWIGIEFETGFDDSREYQNVMNYLWRHHENNAVDYEGCGDYPCEITFSPVNMEDFHKPNYNMDRLLTWLNEKGYEQGDREYSEPVGIHVNISTPSIRRDAAKCQAIAECLSETLEDGDCDSERYFKREPYGFYEQRSTADGQCWIEGKLFNSTHSLSDWEEYKITINNMALLFEHLSTVSNDQLQHKITNLDAILSGDVDAEDVEFAEYRFGRHRHVSW